MLYQIKDGTVSLGGIQVLSHIDFEIKGREKIGVVGINGAGKTTLLRLLGGELELDQDDRRQGPGIFQSRKLTVAPRLFSPAILPRQTASPVKWMPLWSESTYPPALTTAVSSASARR